ncbi:rhodanese-like domain-containing protein [Pseudooceanicola sp. CBS1P-1]|uniref:Rhodanese-like domain-containing protein n=1 Tax=Pseudooceanicola albus TaxID=2692189 RepID=A0A6L7G7Z2_9RHOB|nr:MULTISPECIES: rhodanese-like domain-containing protein [Pseudooceanicola]MBT9384139.1 rhodanese-like domain-containing protein [Pseudooceanicola endophyticus]MXN19762.1 rhodanese-like domain-containing protein [Pseudooceanicola albus]
MKTETVNGMPLETWTPQEVRAALQAGQIVLIDVRTPQEYMFEHIEGALLMPMSFFTPATLPGQESKRIVLHCGSGMRSDKVARRALEAGLPMIAHMEGGFGAWKAAGLPYTGTDMATGAPKPVTP